MIGKKVALRAMEPADVDLLYNWENDLSVWQLSNTIAPFSRFVLEQYVMNADQDIYSSKQLRLMIVTNEENEKPRTIGSIDLFDFDPKNLRVGIGILIIKEEREKGYASEALELVIRYVFDTLCLHQIYCNIPVGNESSIKLFQKMGFKVAGQKKDWLIINKQWVVELLLQLINQ